MTEPSIKRNLQLARDHLANAVRALPRHPQGQAIALLIEEAIEVSYEVELTSAPPENCRNTVEPLVHPALGESLASSALELRR